MLLLSLIPYNWAIHDSYKDGYYLLSIIRQLQLPPPFEFMTPHPVTEYTSESSWAMVCHLYLCVHRLIVSKG